VSPAGRSRFILTDTVGFIQKLPTQLVAAFKATLEELADADLLLHVVDASHPRAREQMDAVARILRELALEDRSTLVVANKTDRLGPGDAFLRQMEQEGGIPVSALGGAGTAGLLDRIDAALSGTRLGLRVRVPHSRAAVLSLLYERGRVLSRQDEPDAVWLEVEVPRSLAGAVSPYSVDGHGPTRDRVSLVAAPASSKGGEP
jgi:GTP-binding protein HflX